MGRMNSREVTGDRVDGGLPQGRSSGDCEQWVDLGIILEVEPEGFLIV